MKDERYFIAGNGLKLMFIGQLVALFSILPLIGGLAVIVGGIFSIVGLVKTRTADPGYQRALIMMALMMVAAVLTAVMAAVAVGGAVLGSGGTAAGSLSGALVLAAAVSVFGFLQTYFIACAASYKIRHAVVPTAA